ncbi:aKG-HExxH-type peptide beta-hydroxylase [Histidinibacterium lentulum]|uniref:HEXXH motif domain-containing protein n=1 Tax=Histidinibacterium lentulum TaxID=2480588 RepID=A0A3N2R945_9RHOB|nr:HEXXH motif-containing putative peptide modification protein [Histidinibacterium lentulum]ROU04000.1 hypothetical protein EAT49_00930 [Histidinibacterium lentulum]
MSLEPDMAAPLSMRTDAETIRRIKLDVRRRLHRSLDHLIFEAAADQVPPALSRERLAALTLSEPFPSPIVFAAHAALLRAAETDRADLFARDSAALAALPEGEHHAPEAPVMALLHERALSPAACEFLKRAFLDDIGLTADLVGPSEEEADRAADLVGLALSGFGQALPERHAEFSALVCMIVLAKPGPEADRGFGGATVFDAFGAVLVNVEALKSPARTLMTLVHEAAHQQLFLCHLDDPVLLNDAEPRHVSPLRKEPRPMEGVFHAAWVSAKMALVADAMLRSGNSPQWVAELAAYRESSIAAVQDALPTIEAGAEFTPLGAELFRELRSTAEAL